MTFYDVVAKSRSQKKFGKENGSNLESKGTLLRTHEHTVDLEQAKQLLPTDSSKISYKVFSGRKMTMQEKTIKDALQSIQHPATNTPVEAPEQIDDLLIEKMEGKLKKELQKLETLRLVNQQLQERLEMEAGQEEKQKTEEKVVINIDLPVSESQTIESKPPSPSNSEEPNHDIYDLLTLGVSPTEFQETKKMIIKSDADSPISDLKSTMSRFMNTQKLGESHWSDLTAKKEKIKYQNDFQKKASLHFLKSLYKLKGFKDQLKQEEAERIKRERPYLYANKYLQQNKALKEQQPPIARDMETFKAKLYRKSKVIKGKAKTQAKIQVPYQDEPANEKCVVWFDAPSSLPAGEKEDQFNNNHIQITTARNLRKNSPTRSSRSGLMQQETTEGDENKQNKIAHVKIPARKIASEVLVSDVDKIGKDHMTEHEAPASKQRVIHQNAISIPLAIQNIDGPDQESVSARSKHSPTSGGGPSFIFQGKLSQRNSSVNLKVEKQKSSPVKISPNSTQLKTIFKDLNVEVDQSPNGSLRRKSPVAILAKKSPFASYRAREPQDKNEVKDLVSNNFNQHISQRPHFGTLDNSVSVASLLTGRAKKGRDAKQSPKENIEVEMIDEQRTSGTQTGKQFNNDISNVGQKTLQDTRTAENMRNYEQIKQQQHDFQPNAGKNIPTESNGVRTASLSRSERRSTNAAKEGHASRATEMAVVIRNDSSHHISAKGKEEQDLPEVLQKKMPIEQRSPAKGSIVDTAEIYMGEYTALLAGEISNGPKRILNHRNKTQYKTISHGKADSTSTSKTILNCKSQSYYLSKTKQIQREKGFDGAAMTKLANQLTNRFKIKSSLGLDLRRKIDNQRNDSNKMQEFGVGTHQTLEDYLQSSPSKTPIEETSRRGLRNSRRDRVQVMRARASSALGPDENMIPDIFGSYCTFEEGETPAADITMSIEGSKFVTPISGIASTPMDTQPDLATSNPDNDSSPQICHIRPQEYIKPIFSKRSTSTLEKDLRVMDIIQMQADSVRRISNIKEERSSINMKDPQIKIKTNEGNIKPRIIAQSALNQLDTEKSSVFGQGMFTPGTARRVEYQFLDHGSSPSSREFMDTSGSPEPTMRLMRQPHGTEVAIPEATDTLWSGASSKQTSIKIVLPDQSGHIKPRFQINQRSASDYAFSTNQSMISPYKISIQDSEFQSMETEAKKASFLPALAQKHTSYFQQYLMENKKEQLALSNKKEIITRLRARQNLKEVLNLNKHLETTEESRNHYDTRGLLLARQTSIRKNMATIRDRRL